MSERIYQVIIGVLVLVVLVGGWLMIASKRAKTTSTKMDTEMTATANGASADTTGDSAQTTATKNTTVASGDAVSVSDQSAGKKVSVDSVTVGKRAWVAIQDSKNWTLGAERVEAGTTKNVAVTLLRATVKGETYKAVLYVDNGDGTFDIHKDTLVTKADGSVLSSAFIAK